MKPVTPPKWKQAVVTLAFIGLLWGSVELNKKNVRSANGPTKADPQAVERYGFKLEDVAKASGIDFVHQPPKLDPKLAPIQERVSDMGAAIAASAPTRGCNLRPTRRVPSDKPGFQPLMSRH